MGTAGKFTRNQLETYRNDCESRQSLAHYSVQNSVLSALSLAPSHKVTPDTSYSFPVVVIEDAELKPCTVF